MDRRSECNTIKSSITSLAYLIEHLLKMYSWISSSDNSMSDEAEREEIMEETHELEDAEQDELEDDDQRNEDETDQSI